MNASPTARFSPSIVRTLQILLIIVVLCGQFNLRAAHPTKAFAGPLTIGGLIALSEIALNKINTIVQNAIANAGDQVRRSVDELRANLQTLINSLSQTYQDNLNLTIDSLDALTSNKLIQLQGLINQVNQALQDDINLIAQQTRNIINQVALQAAQLIADVEQRINNLVVVTSDAVVFVVDRALFNVILVIALILLGLGLLLFIYLIFSRKLPQGLARIFVLAMMAAYLLVFGALALVPSVRARAMSAANLGFEKELQRVTQNVPEVVGADPATITIGQTSTVKLIGVGLRPENKAVTAKIGTQTVPVAAANKEAILTVSGVTLANGPHEAVLLYDGVVSEKTRVLLTVERLVTPPPPADLTITQFTINPTSPVQRGNATATIRVVNQGGTAASGFTVQWKPFAAHPGLTQSVSSLAPGAAQTFTFNHSYINAGSVDSVATVDVNNAVAESNEGNNNRNINGISVQPAPLRRFTVRVNFGLLVIHSDADPLPFDSGDMIFTFNVGGATARFPNSDSFAMSDGDSTNVNRSLTVTLDESQTLSIFISGIDSDGGLAGDDDQMGTITRSFRSAENFGAGSYNIRSNCPDGCYTIGFTVSVTPIN